MAGLPPFVIAWLVPVWIMLGLSRLAVLVLPARRLGPFMGAAAALEVRPPSLDDAQRARAVQIGRVVRLAARYAPWNANCFAQALTARALMGLYRVPCGIFFGLTRAPSTRELHAHAWVAAGDVKITGGDGFARYAVVAAYVSPAPRERAAR